LEIAELFAPARKWQRAAPIERSIDLLDLLHGTPLTMVAWGWAVEVRREMNVWVVGARKGGVDLDIRGAGRADTYPEALCLLAGSLVKSVASCRKAPAASRIAA
jgi:hypothetical protein